MLTEQQIKQLDVAVLYSLLQSKRNDLYAIVDSINDCWCDDTLEKAFIEIREFKIEINMIRKELLNRGK